jgi:hypothetical protein
LRHLEKAIADSHHVLATADLRGDPYWPKWSAPWWHFLALVEAGRADAVPRGFAHRLLEKCAAHYLPFFPRTPEQLPPGKDARTDVMCFCALGSVLTASLLTGLTESEIEAALPWAPAFIAQNQQGDGGWNCDEGVHARSSVVSTVPVLEYLVEKPTLERERLDRGLTFLLELKLCRSRTTGRLLNEDWLTRAAPRFYEYDVLRGLDVAERAAKRLGRELPDLSDVRALVKPGHRNWALGQGTRGPHGVTTSFPLLDVLSQRWDR